MKKLFITALFAILMGGFTLTANAQDGKDDSQTSKKATPKLVAQENQGSLEAKEYEPQVVEFEKAVNDFVNAYKAGLEQNVTGKNKPVDLEGLMNDAQKKLDDLQLCYKKLSISQQGRFKEAKKLFEITKKEFTKK